MSTQKYEETEKALKWQLGILAGLKSEMRNKDREKDREKERERSKNGENDQRELTVTSENKRNDKLSQTSFFFKQVK